MTAPSRKMRAIAATSAAVPKRPACPDVPVNANAFSSWTSPRRRRIRHSVSSSVATQRSERRGPKSASSASTGPRTRSRISSPNGAPPIGRERLREHDVAEVAVGERAKVLGERLLRDAPERLLPGLRLLPQREPPLEAGGVRQHVPQRDVVLPTTAEIGDELAEGSLERDDLVLDERQDQSGGRELRQRCEVEERIHGARSVRTRARIGAQRPDGELVDLAAALHTHDARRVERADRRRDDRHERAPRDRSTEVAHPGADRVAGADGHRQRSDRLARSGEDLGERAQRRHPAVVRADAGGDVRRDAHVVRPAQ